MNARAQLIAYYMIGKMLMDGDTLTAAAPKAPQPSDEYKQGFAVANEGGKLKTNPYEGGSPQWWDWNNGYKHAKQMSAEQARRVAVSGE